MSSSIAEGSSNIEQRLAALEAQLAASQRRARRWKLGVASAAVLGLSMASLRALAAPGSPLACDPAYTNQLFCFAPNTPASAAQVNSNFQAVLNLLAAKVGVPLATAEADPATASGIVSVGALAAKNVAIDSDEILARNGNAGSVLLVQDGAGAGNTQLNANSGQVVIGANAMTPTTVKLKAFGTTDLSSLIVGTGDRITRIEVGQAGTCGSNSIGPGPVTIPFKSAFPTAPFVFTQPVEPDQSGCTSVRVQSVSATGFSIQTWTGAGAQACDCVYYVALSI